ncbi:MAG: hypothetical protein FLDDKLPJ_03257 [Phycisphaerae bacterium]|nr:hypothetical protein [Phycisphaerae bacterium]
MHDGPATPPPVNEPQRDAPRTDLTVRKPWESAILSILLLCGASWTLESVLTALSASPNAAWTWIHLLTTPQLGDSGFARLAFGCRAVTDLGTLLMAALAAVRARRTVSALRIAGALHGLCGLMYLLYTLSLASRPPPPLSAAWAVFTLLGIAYLAPAGVCFMPRAYFENLARPAVAVAAGMALYEGIANMGNPLFHLWWSAANNTFWFPWWENAWAGGLGFVSLVLAAGIHKVPWMTRRFGWLALTVCAGMGAFETVQWTSGGVYADGFEYAAHVVPSALHGVLWLQLMKCVRAEARVRGIGAACRHCEYDLTGNVSGVCPECGSAVR